jgi:hypothetical protein
MSSFDHKPHNPNGDRGISRSGRTNGFEHTPRHPTDPSWVDKLIDGVLWSVIGLVSLIILWSLTSGTSFSVWENLP